MPEPQNQQPIPPVTSTIIARDVTARLQSGDPDLRGVLDNLWLAAQCVKNDRTLQKIENLAKCTLEATVQDDVITAVTINTTGLRGGHRSRLLTKDALEVLDAPTQASLRKLFGLAPLRMKLPDFSLSESRINPLPEAEFLGMPPALRQRLAELGHERVEIMKFMAGTNFGQPETAHLLAPLSRRLSELQKIDTLATQYRNVVLEELTSRMCSEECEAAGDSAGAEFFRAEEYQFATTRVSLQDRLLRKVLHPDQMFSRNAFVTIYIRGGLGGNVTPGLLFVQELRDMYLRYAEQQKIHVEFLRNDEDPQHGGVRHVTFKLESEDAYGFFRHESGIHRREGKFGSAEQAFTAYAKVVVLPEVEEGEIEIRDEDIKRETMPAGGPGGQHQNKTETAVRLTHLPSGITVTCRDERSQHLNEKKAKRLLFARVAAHAAAAREEELARQEQDLNSDEFVRHYDGDRNRARDVATGLEVNLKDLLGGHELGSLLTALVDREINRRLWDETTAGE